MNIAYAESEENR